MLGDLGVASFRTLENELGDMSFGIVLELSFDF